MNSTVDGPAQEPTKGCLHRYQQCVYMPRQFSKCLYLDKIGGAMPHFYCRLLAPKSFGEKTVAAASGFISIKSCPSNSSLEANQLSLWRALNRQNGVPKLSSKTEHVLSNKVTIQTLPVHHLYLVLSFQEQTLKKATFLLMAWNLLEILCTDYGMLWNIP